VLVKLPGSGAGRVSAMTVEDVVFAFTGGVDDLVRKRDFKE
jgi:hypothetical protein